jgi:putative transcriptional regulator
MKRTKAKTRRGATRNLFAELGEGMKALGEARQGKRTLRTHSMEFKPAPELTLRRNLFVCEKV